MIDCIYCKGNVGRPLTEKEPFHYLCKARSKQGLDTPCLGVACPDCQGAGHQAKAAYGSMLFLDLSPSEINQALRHFAPKCPTCLGKGVVPKT